MVEQLHLEQFYTRRGIDLITPEVGTQMMTRVMGQNAAHLIIISANWAVTRASLPEGSWPSLFQLLDQQGGEAVGADAEGEQELLARLKEMKAADRLGLIESSLQETVAQILQMEPGQFSAQVALTSLGMDSMMAIEIQTRIANSMRVEVSVLELLQGITVAQLAARLLTSLQLDEPDGLSTETDELAPTALPDEIEELLALVDQEELERLLTELERSSEGILGPSQLKPESEISQNA
jgi:acyl carrier protein